MIELRIIAEIIDTEPDLPSHQGVVVRVGRSAPLVSETPDIHSIMQIAKVVCERNLTEVKDEFMDALDSASRQPGL